MKKSTATVYICDICGTEHRSKDDCKMCENIHRKLKEVVSSEYETYCKFPTRIIVKFKESEYEDEREVEYFINERNN